MTIVIPEEMMRPPFRDLLRYWRPPNLTDVSTGSFERPRGHHPLGSISAPGSHFWRGKSGRIYRHTVTSLIGCPISARGAYVLVRITESGQRTMLCVGITDSDSPTLNLAHIRRRGARLGADEVHLLPMSSASGGLRRVARDLRRAPRKPLA